MNYIVIITFQQLIVSSINFNDKFQGLKAMYIVSDTISHSTYHDLVLLEARTNTNRK